MKLNILSFSEWQLQRMVRVQRMLSHLWQRYNETYTDLHQPPTEESR